jgi:hypothetical protein
VGNDVLCQVCLGVLPASGREAYTAARARLIVTNGYCDGGCAERAREAQQAAAGAVAAPPVPPAPQAQQQQHYQQQALPQHVAARTS